MTNLDLQAVTSDGDFIRRVGDTLVGVSVSELAAEIAALSSSTALVDITSVFDQPFGYGENASVTGGDPATSTEVPA